MAEGSLLLFALMLFLYFTILKASKKPPIALILSSILVMICFAPIVPYYMPRQTAPSTADSIKILHFNVLYTNRNKDALIRFVQRENPDLISLQEYTEWWQYEVGYSKVFRQYPYHYVSLQGGDAIFSRRPLINPHLEWIAGSLSSADVSIVTQIKIANRPVTFLFSHTPIPLFPDPYQRQVQHFHFWAKKWGHFPGDFVLLGDMNTTPWTMEFQQFIQKTNLQESQLGFGLQPSFPSFNAFIRIPIDHCLVSQNIVVKDRHLAPDLGSDHLPVIFRLALKQ
jgi:endonuclease/exonuclease/phosphatase (EEP) superfamily protein YafD